MTTFSSVAILEKFALLRIAFCKAPVLRRDSSRRTSITAASFCSRALLWCERLAEGLPGAVIGFLSDPGQARFRRWSHHQTCPTRSQGKQQNEQQRLCRRASDTTGALLCYPSLRVKDRARVRV